MIGFLAVAVALMLLAAGVLLRPLLRDAGGAAGVPADAIVGLFRERLRELDAERDAGTLAKEQYEQLRRGLERELFDVVAGGRGAPAATGPARARWTAALVGLLLFALPVVLYINLGAPLALMPGAIRPAGEAAQADGAARALSPEQVQKMIDEINAALQKNPGDVQRWTMLARAYAYLRQYPDAVRAYTRAVALTPKDARLLADLADAMAMAGGERLDGEPMKLIERALQIDPRDVKALALAGTSAFDHKQYDKAIGYWERALQVLPPQDEFAGTLRGSVAEARQLAAGGAPPLASPIAGAPAAAGAAVRGKVTLAAGLAARAQPGDTVFVFARAAQGPKLPLAMLRRQVKDLPFEFALDDSMSMVPEYTLSKYAPVVVGARISRSGDAIAAAGDLQGFSRPVPAGASGVDVTIDQVVR